MRLRRWLLAVACCLGLVAAASPVSHAIQLTDCNELGIDGIACEEKLNKDNSQNNVVGQAIRIALGALAAIAILIIVVAGFQFALSQGDQAKVKTARQTILYAVVGLVLAVSASVIVTFVTNNIK